MVKYISIPKKLENILRQSQDLEGIVKKTLADFSPIFRDNKLFFFEEYTDHGIEHIESVLLASEEILDSQTLDLGLLSPLDIAIFILSVIIHDIGMHVDFATFKALIEGNEHDDVIVNALDYKTWSQLWEDYLSEAKKFNSKQRLAIFGDENWVFKIPDLSHKNLLNGFDKKLIGEFIRRFHPRLSQEIALKGGIIGKDGQIFNFATSLSPLNLKLVGIVARSHGMEIRDTFNYLKEIADLSWKKPANVNIIFLMVLIRISDYFQIDSKRVDPNLLKLKTFSSPFSDLENNKHLCVQSVTEWHEDPETLMVLAAPTTSLIHLKLVELFRDVQYELDVSWAVLGEVYGKEANDKQPKIKYRRILSNLNKGSSLYNIVSYVPERMVFEADSELIKLLIAPLYGNNPTFGVRELLQNSLDACNERTHLEKQKSSISYIPFIKLTINKDLNSFTIEDNGKGMSLFEIKTYFLKAGASFRKSLDWKKDYTDDAGKPLIDRNGRFGVGVLASFLLGREIEVITRNANETDGYKFKAWLDSEQIEVIKTKNIEVGTSIKVNLNNDVATRLLEVYPRWDDWYRLSSPQILFEIVNDEKVILSKSQSFDNPNKDDQLSNQWHRIIVPGFGQIHWSYYQNLSKLPSNRRKENYTMCNGILIPSEYNIVNNSSRNMAINVNPLISFFDEEGSLPLTLNRNSVEGRLPFNKELFEDLCKDFIAKLLTFNPINKMINNTVTASNYSFNHPASSFNFNVYVSPSGFLINYNWFRRKLPSDFRAIKLNVVRDNSIIGIVKFDENIDFNKYLFFTQISDFSTISSYKEAIDPYYYYGSSGGTVFLRNSFYEDVVVSTNVLRGRFSKDYLLVNKNERWSALDYKFRPISPHRINKFMSVDSSNLHSFILFDTSTVPYPRNSLDARGFDFLNIMFDKYFQSNFLIPYDMEERKKVFSTAFIDLERYMRKYL